MKKLVSIVLALVIVLGVFSLTSCSQANRVSTNISNEADRFNVTRRIVVINARTDKPVFELIGNFSLSNNMNGELEIICEVEQGKYKKHFIYLNDWTIYTVEDISGAYVDNYHYEVNYLPEMINPITITTKD